MTTLNLSIHSLVGNIIVVCTDGKMVNPDDLQHQVEDVLTKALTSLKNVSFPEIELPNQASLQPEQAG